MRINNHFQTQQKWMDEITHANRSLSESVAMLQQQVQSLQQQLAFLQAGRFGTGPTA